MLAVIGLVIVIWFIVSLFKKPKWEQCYIEQTHPGETIHVQGFQYRQVAGFNDFGAVLNDGSQLAYGTIVRVRND